MPSSRRFPGRAGRRGRRSDEGGARTAMRPLIFPLGMPAYAIMNQLSEWDTPMSPYLSIIFWAGSLLSLVFGWLLMVLFGRRGGGLLIINLGLVLFLFAGVFVAVILNLLGVIFAVLQILKESFPSAVIGMLANFVMLLTLCRHGVSVYAYVFERFEKDQGSKKPPASSVEPPHNPLN